MHGWQYQIETASCSPIFDLKATHLYTAINAVDRMPFICKYPKGHIDMFVNGMPLNSWEEGKDTRQMSSNSCLVI